jgi:VanZ family protein
MISPSPHIKVLYILQWFLYSAIIFILSHQPHNEYIPISIWDYDKLLHLAGFFLYGISSFLVIWTAFPSKSFKFRYLFTISLATLFAFSDELHQSFIPGRLMDPFDLIADCSGIIFSYFLFRFLLINIFFHNSQTISHDA